MIQKLIEKLCGYKCQIRYFCPVKTDLKRKHKLGSRFINATGQTFQYAKIDFGIMGKDKKGKIYRNIQYAWIRIR